MLSYREHACLKFLSPTMGALVEQIGEKVAPKPGRTKRGYKRIGTNVVRSLHDKGLVYYLRDWDAWRVTQLGRAALQTQK